MVVMVLVLEVTVAVSLVWVGGAAVLLMFQSLRSSPACPTPHPAGRPPMSYCVLRRCCPWTWVSMCPDALASVLPKFTKPL